MTLPYPLLSLASTNTYDLLTVSRHRVRVTRLVEVGRLACEDHIAGLCSGSRYQARRVAGRGVRSHGA